MKNSSLFITFRLALFVLLNKLHRRINSPITNLRDNKARKAVENRPESLSYIVFEMLPRKQDNRAIFQQTINIIQAVHMQPVYIHQFSMKIKLNCDVFGQE